MKNILEARDIVKNYPGIRALDYVTLEVYEGECLGLIGPNGAGKTTFIEILEGLREPDSGRILFRGHAFPANYKEFIGIQLQKASFPDFLTVRETITLFANLYKKSRNPEEMISLFELQEFINRDTRQLSGGQFLRMSLAIALINDPELIFLDEPSTGLDPEARRQVWDLILQLKNEGKTIILTTHFMEEAEKLCDRIGFLDRGRLIDLSTPAELCRKYNAGKYIELKAEEQPLVEAINLEYLLKNDKLLIPVQNIKEVLPSLIDCDIDLENLKIYDETLDDIYVKLVNSPQVYKAH
ncbi:MAG: ABC transporter ATP-binding protein [Ferruginibacter sp.]